MEIILSEYSIFMAHIVSLFQTDSQALKQAGIEGLAKKLLQGKKSYAFSYIFRSFNTN